jgi:hypothetical protein
MAATYDDDIISASHGKLQRFAGFNPTASGVKEGAARFT